jgi:hypothetical protein
MTKLTISLPDDQAQELKELTPGKGETSEFVSGAITDALARRRSDVFFSEYFAQVGSPSAQDEAWIEAEFSRRRAGGTCDEARAA